MSINEPIANYVEITNPFDIKARIDKDILVNLKPTLQCLKPTMFEEYIACVNGELIDEKDWASRVIQEGDYVVFSPVPQGGGGSKSVLRMVAIIAIAVAAPQLAPGLAQMMGVAGTTGTLLVQTGIVIAGGLLVNSLIPIEPNATPIPDSLSSSPTYGIDGAKNTAEEGIVVPVLYGQYRVAGNLVDFYVENNNSGNQDLYARFVISEGPINFIAPQTIKVNDQPIANFADYSVWYSKGDPLGEVYRDGSVASDSTQADDPADAEANLTNRRAAHPFGASYSSVSVGVRLTDSYQTRETQIEVDALRIDIVAPSGWRSLSNDGASRPLVQELYIEYRSFTDRDAAGEWTRLMVTDYEGQQSQTIYVYTGTILSNYSREQYYASLQRGFVKNGIIYQSYRKRIDRDTQKTVIVPVGYVIEAGQAIAPTTIAGRFGSAHRVSFRADNLPEDRYEVRVRRSTEESTSDRVIDQLNWADLVQVVNDDVRLKHTAWLGVRIRMDDQLSSVPKVTVEAGGRVGKTYRRNEDTGEIYQIEGMLDNPAWVEYDMMTDSRIGLGIPESQMDLNQYVAWADFCEKNGLTFNAIFDQELGFWDARSHVMRVGRAKPVNIGTRYSVAFEGPTIPSAMFSVANMEEDSFSISWTEMADRSNVIELTYFDKEDDYKPKIIRVSDDVPGTAIRRESKLTLFGVTDFEQAVKEGNILLKLNKYVTQTVTFVVPVEAISVSIGDVALIQHDIPQWGYAGRVYEKTGSFSVELDTEVPFEQNESYQLLIHADMLIRGTHTVESIFASRYVRINGENPTQKITRARIDGVEYEVKDYFYDSIGEGVILGSDVPPSVIGQTIELIETDALLTLTVSNVSTVDERSTVTVTGALPEGDLKYTKWLYGPIQKEAKPFRISAIETATELTRKIVAREYSDLVYEEGPLVPAPNYSSLTGAVAHVTEVSYTQDGMIKSGIYRPSVFLSWKNPTDERFSGATILMRAVGELNWKQLDELPPGREAYEYTGGALGDEIELGVLSKGALQSASTSSMPKVSLTISNPPPPDVNTLFISDGKLSWTYPDKPLDHAGFELRYHGSNRTTWADATPLHSGIVTSSPFSIKDYASGTVTFLIKALDTSGKYSQNAIHVTTDINQAESQNAFLTRGMKETPAQWSEVITGGTKQPNNEIEADSLSSFFGGNASLPFYDQTTTDPNDNDPFYVSSYSQLVSVVTITIDPSDIGASLKFEFETNGFSATLEYLPQGAAEYLPFNGRIEAIDVLSYQVRITVPEYTGSTPPRITEARYAIDVEDITEAFEDVTVTSDGNYRLPIAKTYREIKHVSLTLQADASGAATLKLVDKDATLGPRIEARDLSGNLVQTTIDAFIRGF